MTAYKDRRFACERAEGTIAATKALVVRLIRVSFLSRYGPLLRGEGKRIVREDDRVRLK